jgi:hypothetical protein
MPGLLSPRKVPPTPTRVTLLGAVWEELLKSMFDPYRPERHYMRGPGPKWWAKHHGETSR